MAGPAQQTPHEDRDIINFHSATLHPPSQLAATLLTARHPTPSYVSVHNQGRSRLGRLIYPIYFRQNIPDRSQSRRYSSSKKVCFLCSNGRYILFSGACGPVFFCYQSYCHSSFSSPTIQSRYARLQNRIGTARISGIS